MPGGGGVRESGHLTRTTQREKGGCGCHPTTPHPACHPPTPSHLVSALAWGSRPAIPVQHQGSTVAPFARRGRRAMWLAPRCGKHPPAFPTFQKVRSLFRDGVCSSAIARHRSPPVLRPGSQTKTPFLGSGISWLERETTVNAWNMSQSGKCLLGTVCAEPEYLRAAQCGMEAVSSSTCQPNQTFH